MQQWQEEEARTAGERCVRTWQALPSQARCKDLNDATVALLAPLSDAGTWDRVVAERAMNRRLEGGCQVPIAGYAELRGDQLWLRALVASEDGTRVLRAEAEAPRTEAAALGHEVAGDLLAQGAAEILAEVYGRA